jgi:hypothetical protein
MKFSKAFSWFVVAFPCVISQGLVERQTTSSSQRRATLGWIGGACAAGLIAASPSEAWGASAAVQDSMNVDSYLRTGIDMGGNMGVSSQAGKSRPETGVYLR